MDILSVHRGDESADDWPDVLHEVHFARLQAAHAIRASSCRYATIFILIPVRISVIIAGLSCVNGLGARDAVGMFFFYLL